MTRDLEQFDAVIIGTGQAGKPLAGALDDAGWKVAIVEKGRVGGTCAIDGCTPTKTMIASARVAELARRAREYGVEVGNVRVDMEAVRRRKRALVDEWSTGAERGLRRRAGVELIFGEARFTAPRDVLVTLTGGGERHLTAPRVFINTGTRTFVPDLPGLSGVPWLDNASVMELGEVPEHLVVLGGGFIGLEFAQMFRRFGAAVTVVEAADRLVAREDEDVSEALAELLAGEGVAVHTATRVESVRSSDDGGVLVRLRQRDEERELAGSHLLLAVGRRPNADALGLEAAGIERDARGYVKVDARLETNVSGVYALGDVNGGPPFTHASYDDFRIVRTNLLEGGGASREDRLMPYVLFTDPQLGRVGLTEREARERGLDVEVAKLPMSRVARAIETAETRGFLKAVVERGSGRILGAAMLGLEGGELLAVVQVAMVAGLPYPALRDGIFAHPTLAEGLNNLFMTLPRQARSGFP